MMTTEAEKDDLGSAAQPSGPETTSGGAEAERSGSKREEWALRKRISTFRAGGRLSREDVHLRRRSD